MPSSRASHALTAVLWGLCAAAQAQAVYRIVGPDGRVTFSDRPPQTANEKAAPVRGGAAASAANEQLPFELRQVAQRFPVTLYTMNSCVPCASARSLLANRGIPYSEKTINTVADGEALRNLFNDNSLPVLSIGNQQLKGYTETEWHSYLDAAGYPRESALPPNYKPAAPSPLAAVVPAAPAEAGKPAPTPKPAPLPAVTPNRASPNNPAGLQF